MPRTPDKEHTAMPKTIEEQNAALLKFVRSLAGNKSDIEFSQKFDKALEEGNTYEWNTGNADDDREQGEWLATGRIGIEARDLLNDLGIE